MLRGPCCWFSAFALFLLATPRAFPAAPEVPEMVLQDQHAQPFRISRDLLKDRVVAFNTIFTSCTTICPVMSVALSQLKKELGPGDASRLLIISISVDPVSDTPARLLEFAQRFGDTPGWTLLTGPKSDVDRLLKFLGLYTAARDSHSPGLVFWSESGRTLTSALSPVPQLAALVRDQLKGAARP